MKISLSHLHLKQLTNKKTNDIMEKNIKKRVDFMKKLIAVLCALICFSFGAAEAAYSQQDMYDLISSTCSWMDKNASPLKNPDSSSSDYFIMAMARMNKSYDFEAFAKLSDSKEPSTYRDGQRIVMTKTACDSAVSDSMLKTYTYDIDKFDNLTDLAGAIITLNCGRYAVNDEGKSKDTLIADLLSSQHNDGSFSGDCYTTALSIIALAPYNGMSYTAGSKKTVASYSVESALSDAVQYLENAKGPDFGYANIRTTAFVIIALDSLGIDTDNDAAFSDGGSSPVSWLISQQAADGSFNSSAEDTAFALCALTSRLRAMQGKSPFFSFSEKDSLNFDEVKSGGTDAAAEESAEQTTPNESAAQEPGNSVSDVFATPVPASENPGGNTKHVIIVSVMIFTTVIFFGVCTYIVIRFKFPELLKRLKKKQQKALRTMIKICKSCFFDKSS